MAQHAAANQKSALVDQAVTDNWNIAIVLFRLLHGDVRKKNLTEEQKAHQS